MKTIWYYFIKVVVKTSLFFYSKNIRVKGKENIPKKGAVMFLVNHPDGLLDPLIVATNNPRVQHFLVRAASFKKPFIKKLLSTLNLMPIYRIRDGVSELSRNQEVFETCYQILKNKKALMIFPEGSHNRKRTIRPLSKGFSRIIFGAIEKYPNLNIHLIPVGFTYQNASVFPVKALMKYGTPILANDFYDPKNQNERTKDLKHEVSEQLKKLSFHIPDDEHYQKKLDKLNTLNVDFTADEFKERKRGNLISNLLKPLLILNTLIPYLLWKQVAEKIDEIEFVDTFRFGINMGVVPLFYGLQTWLISYFLGAEIGWYYLGGSLLLLLLYSKLHTTPAELPLE